MPTLPISGYLSSGSRTEGEMKDGFEDVRDVAAQFPGSGEGAEALTISAGAITPSLGQVTVDTEGGTGSDDLITIQTTNLPDGALLWLNTASSARDVTVKHLTGNISLRDGADITLGNSADRMLLRRDGSDFIELFTFFHNAADQRDYLALGDAATANQGSGNGLDADTVDTKHASDFLGVSDQAADSDKLDGVEGANYARKDVSSAQAFLGNVIAAVKSVANDPSTSTPQFELQDNGVRRGLLFMNGFDIFLRLYESNGTTVDATFKLTSTALYFSPDGESTWYEVHHDGISIDADTLGGYALANLPIGSAQIIAGSPGTNYVAGLAGGYEVIQIAMNRFSFYPRIEANSAFDVRAKLTLGGLSPDPQNPAFAIQNNEDVNHNYCVSWEYLS